MTTLAPLVTSLASCGVTLESMTRFLLTLEKAVWRLTGHPADVFGLRDRGRIAPGCFADLVAFDPATIAVGEMHRVQDLPAGADRLVARAEGIASVWVNGRPVVEDGADVPFRSGMLIRNGGAR